MVEALGATPVLARDGTEALDRLALQWPHAILYDLFMPGLDGLAFVHHLDANPEWAHIPLIAVTVSKQCGGRRYQASRQ